jgi:hypothetical protein
MSQERAVRTLKSLRDEIYQGHVAGATSVLGHAMMIVVGEKLSEQEKLSSWKGHDRVDRDLSIYPIRRLMNFGLDECYFGDASDASIRRFKDQSEAAVFSALEALASRGRDYRPLPYGVEGWPHLCYCLAWDLSDRVGYKVINDSVFNSVCLGTAGPFFDRKAFQSWCQPGTEHPDGLFFAKLSRDIRICSVSAIDAILKLVAEPEPLSTRPRSFEPARDARDDWVHVKYCAGIPLKKIEMDLRIQDSSWERVCAQRLRPIAEEFAKRKGLPPPPRRKKRGSGSRQYGI